MHNPTPPLPLTSTAQTQQQPSKQPQPCIEFSIDSGAASDLDVASSFTSARVVCDGCTLAEFAGGSDVLYVLSVLVSAYYVFNLAPAAQFATTFNFYETLIFRLHGNTSIQGFKLISSLYTRETGGDVDDPAESPANAAAKNSMLIDVTYSSPIAGTSSGPTITSQS